MNEDEQIAVVVDDEKDNQELEANKPAEEAAKAEAEAKAKAEAEEKDVYAQKLADLKAEKEKQEEINRQKSGALKEEREKNKEWEARFTELENKLANSKAGLTEAELDELLTKREQHNQELNSVLSKTTSESEKALIKEIIKTKGVSPREAFILANAHLVEDSRSRELEANEDKKHMANFLGRQASGSIADVNSALYKEASDGLTENEKKHLKI